MASKQQLRPKHVPQRTCVVCRQTQGKRALIRLVRTPDGVKVDLSGKQAGRGAYVHPSEECWRTAVEQNRLGSALRTRISAANRLELLDFLAQLPVDESER